MFALAMLIFLDLIALAETLVLVRTVELEIALLVTVIALPRSQVTFAKGPPAQTLAVLRALALMEFVLATALTQDWIAHAEISAPV